MATDLLQLKYPIVLIHGMGARSTYGPVNYFYGLPRLLRRAKNPILIAQLTAWHTIEHRSSQLQIQIDKLFPDTKVNLVGHSMGGLDARYLAARPDFTQRVASVTTIGTPNLGSCIGDLALGLLPQSALFTMDRLLKAWDSSSGAFKQVSRKYCTEEFQRLAPKMDHIGYFSATSAITKPIYKKSLPFFWLPYHFMMKVEGENDGFVSVDSAKWGNHICTHAGDHYAQIGQFLGRSRGMDYMKFYEEIFRHLKSQNM
jgi:triacylglycerol lipase